MLIPLLMQLGMLGSTPAGGVSRSSKAKKIEVLDRQSNADFIASFVRKPFEQETKAPRKAKAATKAVMPAPVEAIDPIALLIATED